MGRTFRLDRSRNYAGCSKRGDESLVVSLPWQALEIHVFSVHSVVSPIACPYTSRTTDCNSLELLNAIVSFPLSVFT